MTVAIASFMSLFIHASQDTYTDQAFSKVLDDNYHQKSKTDIAIRVVVDWIIQHSSTSHRHLGIQHNPYFQIAVHHTLMFARSWNPYPQTLHTSGHTILITGNSRRLYWNWYTKCGDIAMRIHSIYLFSTWVHFGWYYVDLNKRILWG